VAHYETLKKLFKEKEYSLPVFLQLDDKVYIKAIRETYYLKGKIIL